LPAVACSAFRTRGWTTTDKGHRPNAGDANGHVTAEDAEDYFGNHLRRRTRTDSSDLAD